MSRGPGLAAVMTVVFLTARSGAARADCANDAQCKGDRICEKGVCVAPAPPAPASAPPPVPPPAVAPVAPPASAPPQQGGTRVIFTGRSDLVSAESNQKGGAHGECHIPCSLQLPPGWYTVRAGSTVEDVEVGDRTTAVKVTSGCTACFVTGGISLGLSIPLFVGGGVLVDKNSTETAGAAMAVAGGIIAASGLALLIVGVAAGRAKIVQDDYAKNETVAPKIGLAPSGVALSF
ncbi:MAG: hypothetical protein KF819_09880 [Labilithrix sp.]|nr:hypothetical protein [Labilithrix sp.]